MNLRKKETILWMLLGILGLLTLCNIIFTAFGVTVRDNTVLFSFLLLFPLILLLIHAAWTLSFKRAILFISLAFAVGLIAEILGVKYGTVFGGFYSYNQPTVALANVPLIIPFYWALFIYSGYVITNSFLVWTNTSKPSVKNKLLFLLPLLILLDGVLVVAIDLFMDPIEVRMGTWSWEEGGGYFGVPFGNFVGWFMVTVITTSLYRVFEYFRPFKMKISDSVYVIPVIGYIFLFITLTSSAIALGLPQLVLIGALCMLPLSIVNLLLYSYWRKTKSV